MSSIPRPEVDVVAVGVVVADHLCQPVSHLPVAGELVMTQDFLLETGGCAANVAVDASKLGMRSAIVGCIGNDVFGDFLEVNLDSRGVQGRSLHRIADSETSQTMILNVKGEDRRFVHSFGANAKLAPKHLPQELIRQSRVLYVGGFFLLPELEPSLPMILRDARQHGTVTVLDVAVPDGSLPGDLLRRLSKVLPETDYFLPNRDEARMITGESDEITQLQCFNRFSSERVVITCGADGAVVSCGNDVYSVGAFEGEYVDGSGGGDAFAAGLIYGIVHGMELRESLTWASALGLSCVGALGTTPGVFTDEECREFIRNRELSFKSVGG